MTELASPDYPKRTRQNVVDSDATILFTVGKISRGTALTLRIAKECGKPFLHVDLAAQPEDQAIQAVTSWLGRLKPKVLNVAGSRESKAPGVYRRVYRVLKAALEAAEITRVVDPGEK
jgi:hypothetical protein